MPLGMARGPDSREEGVNAGVTLQTPWLLDIGKCIMSEAQIGTKSRKGWALEACNSMSRPLPNPRFSVGPRLVDQVRPNPCCFVSWKSNC